MGHDKDFAEDMKLYLTSIQNEAMHLDDSPIKARILQVTIQMWRDVKAEFDC